MVEKLTKPEVIQFIKDHHSDDPFTLSLSAKSWPDIPIREVAGQIKSLQKAKKKLPHWCATGVLFPASLSLEQASSEITAKYKTTLIKDGKHMIDLTGGMGVDCFYLSGKYEETIYLDQQQELVELAIYNFGTLGSEGIQCLQQDALQFITNHDHEPDLIFVDPARRDGAGKKVFLFRDCSPDIESVLDAIVAKKWSSQVMIKLSPMIDIDYLVKTLPGLKDIHVVSLKNECKEVLCLLQMGRSGSDIDIHAVNISNGDSQDFRFSSGSVKSTYHYSLPQSYIYEPNASMMKSGGYHHLGGQNTMNKLHPNTHLFTSDELINDFPGAVYKVISVMPADKKQVAKALASNKVNLKVRNFGQNAAAIAKAFKVKEGGESFLFACTVSDDKRNFILCDRV